MNTALIKRSSTVFLQAIVILIGFCMLAFLLWEPWAEGVNAHATMLSQIYFDDPFLAYVYVSSIAFFIALYQTFALLGYTRENTFFSPRSVRALRMIQFSAIALILLIAGAIAFLFITHDGQDDIAGGVAMGLFATFISIIMATTAAVLERRLRNALDKKSES